VFGAWPDVVKKILVANGFDHLPILCNMDDEDLDSMLQDNPGLPMGHKRSFLLLPRLAKAKGIEFFTEKLSSKKNFGGEKKKNNKKMHPQRI
jgi:hypothetical protein